MIPVLSWWLAIEVIGVLALPLGWQVFARLPGRGYPFAKALGLLLASYVLWLGASFHLLPNTLGGVLAALAVVAGLSWWLGGAGLRRDTDGRRPLLSWLSEHRALVLVTEGLFLLALGAWAFFRAHSGEIAATEKPMEFAFINGVLGSRFFPPHDPWLSGYAISYYYFGYVMLALLVRLTGVAPAVGFNLGVAMWYALVLTGAFGIVFELVRLAEGQPSGGPEERTSGGDAGRRGGGDGRALRWGVLGVLFVGVIGNLEGFVEAGYNARFLPMSLIQWLDIKDLITNPPTGNLAGNGWWWWHASRVIHDKDLLGQSVEVIDEFPFFSFLLGDLHPHVLALPFVLLAIALALQLLLAAQAAWAQTARPGGQSRAQAAPARAGARAGAREGGSLGIVSGDAEASAAGWSARSAGWWAWLSGFWQDLSEVTGLGLPGVLLYGLVLGGLSFLNTWDFPIYLAVTALAFGTGLALKDGLHGGTIGRAALAGVTFGVVGWLAYLPFYVGFQSQAGGILPNLLFPTRFSQFFLMFGLFLVIAVFFLGLLTMRTRDAGREEGAPSQATRSVADRFLAVLPWPVFLPIALLALMLGLAAVLPQGRALIQGLLDDPAVRQHLPVAAFGPLLGLIARVRLSTPWTYLILALLISWGVALLWTNLERGVAKASPGGERKVGRIIPADLFALALIIVALLLAFGVEFVYLKDFFGTRMNTVFKFYYQAWILLALASAYGLSQLAERSAPIALGAPALLLAIVLGCLAMFYPLLATPSKAGDFQGAATLDGLAYMQQSNPGDLAAIDWLRANVPPTAVVVEAPGGSYSPEGAERISMSTGNATLLGWDFHERQWRGNAFDTLTAGRVDALDRIYRTARGEELRQLLDQWHVDYVYIGGLERNKYKITPASLSRFDQAGLKRVYDADGVVIYAN